MFHILCMKYHLLSYKYSQTFTYGHPSRVAMDTGTIACQNCQHKLLDNSHFLNNW